MAWQLQEAKAKFSELVQKAIEEGPQTVTRHGKEAVVILSAEEYSEAASESARPARGADVRSAEGELGSGAPREVQEREIDF